jgi:uncharacterized protein (TIGR02453 family)
MENKMENTDYGACFTGYPKKSLAFLKELRANNTKEWFELHKHLYTEYILEPNRAFVVEMGEHIQALVPTINAIPKINGSLYRIYRDTRFAKDKTPLKTHSGVIFWQGKGKRTHSSNFYTRFTPETCVIGAGIRLFHPEILSAYRSYIKDEKKAAKLNSILSSLKEKGYEISETHYKRLPRGFKSDYPFDELARFNRLVVNKKFSPDKVFYSDELVHRCYSIYEELFELQQWLYEMTLQIKTEE